MSVYENALGLDRFCPVYNKSIGADLCYDSLMCLHRYFKVESTRELTEIEDIDAARVICKNCKFSDLD